MRKRPLYEVVGQLGMWGFIIGGVQASALEWKDMRVVPWTADIIGLIFAFTAAMLILYTVAPMIYRMASSAYFNLSLLSSDFYGLLFGECSFSSKGSRALINHIRVGLFLYKYSPYWLYFLSFVVIIGGLIVYFWHSTREYLFAPPKSRGNSSYSRLHTAEEQGILDPQAPDYVQKRVRDDAAVDEEKASSSNEKVAEVAVVEQK